MTLQTPADDVLPDERGVLRDVRRGAAVRAGRRGARQPGEVRGPVPGPRALLVALQPAPARRRPRTTACPCLERVRSLAFFASNLDEFFMVRVAGLKRRIAAGMAVRAASGKMPREQLEAIWSRSRRADEATRRGLPRRDRARPVGHRDRAGALGRARPRGAEVLQAVLPGPGLPGADPARRRPRPPVPLHLGPVAQHGRAGAQPQDRQGALRPGQGAADVQPLRGRGQPALRAAGGRHRRASQAALPGHGRAPGPHLPGHPQRGPRGRGGRRREPADGPGEGAAAPPSSARRSAWRWRSRSRPRCSSC